MIWLRRILAFPLILLFILLFLVILVVFRVNDTALSADFYIDQLRKADIFTFMYDDVAPAALKEVNKEPQNLPINVEKVGNKGVSLAREVFPPGWLEAQAEQAILQVVPYVVGDEDSFAINIQVRDRLETLGDVLKRELGGGETYNLLFDDIIAPALKDAFEENSTLADLPFGITITSQDIVAAVREVMPPQWVQARVGHVVDQVVPYLTGKQDGFEIVVPLKDRIQVAVPVVKQLLRDLGAYDQVYKEGIAPVLAERAVEAAGGTIGIPVTRNISIKITKEDLTAALQQVPPEELQEQVESAIDEITPYLTGDSDDFELELSAVDAMRLALPVIEKLVKQELKQIYEALPVCGLEAALDFARTGLESDLPLCRPPGFPIEQVQRELGIPGPTPSQKALEQVCRCNLGVVLGPLTFENLLSLLGVDIAKRVEQIIESVFPPVFTYNEANLRDDLSEDHEETLDQVLDWTRNGFTYTDADLREDLVGENGDTTNLETLDQVLEWTRNGLTYTDADLRELAAGDEEAGASFEQFEQARKWLGLARTLRFVPLLVLAGLLAAIGFLGGRGWRSRVVWAAVPLGFAAGIAFAAFGPVYHGVTEPIVDDALAEVTRDTTGVQQLVAQKGVGVAKSVMGDFFAGLANRALLLLIVSVLAVALAILWPTLYRLVRGGPRGEPAPPHLGAEEREWEELGQPGPGRTGEA